MPPSENGSFIFLKKSKVIVYRRSITCVGIHLNVSRVLEGQRHEWFLRFYSRLDCITIQLLK
jgi:hypothetical protein